MKSIRLFTILGGLAAIAVCVGVAISVPQATAQPMQPEGGDPNMPNKGLLKWNFTEGMTLKFSANANQQSISSIKGSTEGAVLRLIAALTNPDEQMREKAAEVLKNGGQKVLDVLVEYVAHEATADEQTALAPIIEHLQEHPDGDAQLPDRLIVAERDGRVTCLVDWKVENVRGVRSTVWTKSHHINVIGRSRTLGQDQYETVRFRQGETMRLDPATNRMVPLEKPDNPIASMFFEALNLDYRFTIDSRSGDMMDFRFTDPAQEADRRQMNLSDPLQIGPSFKRLSGREQTVGDTWQITFDYFAGGMGRRLHICDYTLAEIKEYNGRRVAVMPWRETIYMQAPREPAPGTLVGGGAGEFWMDIDEHVLVMHRTEIAFETKTILEIPRRDAPREKREFETYFTMIMKLDMRLLEVVKEGGR